MSLLDHSLFYFSFVYFFCLSHVSISSLAFYFHFFLSFIGLSQWVATCLYLGNEGIMEIMVLQGPTKTLFICVHVCVLIEVENSSSVKEREKITYYHEIFLWICICFATFLFPCDDRSILSLGDNFPTNDNYF